MKSCVNGILPMAYAASEGEDLHCKKGVKKPGSAQIKRRIVRDRGGQSSGDFCTSIFSRGVQ